MNSAGNSSSSSSGSRVPLKDISESVRTSSHRLNATATKPATNSKAATNVKFSKIVSSSRPSLRRRRTLIVERKSQSSGRIGRRLRAVVDPPDVDPPDVDPPDVDPPDDVVVPIVDMVPPWVSVPDEEMWLCQPSIANDVYLYTKSLEERHCFDPYYLCETDSRVTTEMRATLINWLVEIHGHLKLEPQTLHVAVKLLDATLQHFKVSVTKLQLCGLSVLLIGSKLESRTVSAEELLYLMCHKGDVSILIRMEQAVLNILNFQLHVADPIFFLNRLMLYDENGRSEEFFNICTYCMDSVLHDVSTVKITASEMASSGLLAARFIDSRMDWPRPIGFATGHWPSTKPLIPLALKMIENIVKVNDGTSSYSGAYKKYASYRRFKGLSDSHKFSNAHLRQIMEALCSDDAHLSAHV